MIAWFIAAALTASNPFDTKSGASAPVAQPAAPVDAAGKAVANAAAAKPAAKPPVDLSKIPSHNPFDAHHQAWALPEVPPPPLPPLADNEIRLHGAIIYGSTRKALVELLSPRLQPAGSDPKGKPPRPFRVVGIGDDIGGYRVASITPEEIVFEQGGRTTSLPFTLAKGRAASGGAVPPPEQVAIVLPAPVPTIVGDNGAAIAAADPNAAANTSPQPQPAAATPAPADTAPAPAPAAPTPDPNTNSGNTPNSGGDPNAAQPPGMSLLDAINWARSHSGAAGTGK